MNMSNDPGIGNFEYTIEQLEKYCFKQSVQIWLFGVTVEAMKKKNPDYVFKSWMSLDVIEKNLHGMNWK